MFEALELQPADALLALIKAFQADSREGKIDLGVGVYRDAAGRTPVMKAVKAAETLLLETQNSKRYLGPEGDMGFVEALEPIVFRTGGARSERRVGLQTPGGSGALRLGAELIRTARPKARIWLGTPSWPNHAPIFTAAGLDVRSYGFVDLSRQAIEFQRTLDALSQADEGDVALLHGCCHNPTGIDFSAAQWREIASLLRERRLVPFMDLAYQGLGEGLEPDAAATRLILESAPEALVAYSCDKNFGLYRDRVGALYVQAADREGAQRAISNAVALARVNWSMPPDHGAAVVRMVLEDAELTTIWREELTGMCARINANRAALADADASLAFVRDQKGLFSNLKISKAQASTLRERHAIYLADSGRINLAGMQPADASAIVAALRAENCL